MIPTEIVAALFTVLLALVGFIGARIVHSIDKLNTNVALLLERTSNQEKRIERLEIKMEH